MGKSKKRIAVAKVLFAQGETLKKISEETEISINILKKLSSKENWKKEREKFSQELFEELRKIYLKKHLIQRGKAINVLLREEEKIFYSRLSFSKKMDLVLKNERAIQELLGILSAEKISELELKKMELEKERLYLKNLVPLP